MLECESPNGGGRKESPKAHFAIFTSRQMVVHSTVLSPGLALWLGKTGRVEAMDMRNYPTPYRPPRFIRGKVVRGEQWDKLVVAPCVVMRCLLFK